MLLVKNTGVIDMRDSMYPSIAHKITDSSYNVEPYSTVYGFVLSGSLQINSWDIHQNQYFCYTSPTNQSIQINGTSIIMNRLGFMGQNMVGGPIEKSGRLCYIDGCSDSLLVYPPRLGDPSLNLLYFPANVNQSFHIHPSIRLGVVVNGRGKACLNSDTIELTKGDMFCIQERELHRFTTQELPMTVIAFHPDGDWGPTDHNHTMLNRTYAKKT